MSQNTAGHKPLCSQQQAYQIRKAIKNLRNNETSATKEVNYEEHTLERPRDTEGLAVL